jgi:hypothetical protein
MKVPAPIEREERLEPLEEGVERLRQLIAQEVIPLLETRKQIPLLAAPLQQGVIQNSQTVK